MFSFYFHYYQSKRKIANVNRRKKQTMETSTNKSNAGKKIDRNNNNSNIYTNSNINSNNNNNNGGGVGRNNSNSNAILTNAKSNDYNVDFINESELNNPSTSREKDVNDVNVDVDVDDDDDDDETKKLDDVVACCDNNASSTTNNNNNINNIKGKNNLKYKEKNIINKIIKRHSSTTVEGLKKTQLEQKPVIATTVTKTNAARNSLTGDKLQQQDEKQTQLKLQPNQPIRINITSDSAEDLSINGKDRDAKGENQQGQNKSIHQYYNNKTQPVIGTAPSGSVKKPLNTKASLSGNSLLTPLATNAVNILPSIANTGAGGTPTSAAPIHYLPMRRESFLYRPHDNDLENFVTKLPARSASVVSEQLVSIYF